MPDYSLVPVDYQPDFDDYSLVPVDHDPFAADALPQQAQFQQPPTPTPPAQPQPQQPATGAGQPGVNGPATGSNPSGWGGGGIGRTGGAPNPDQVGASEPLPFSGFANPTPAESLVNRQKMK